MKRSNIAFNTLPIALLGMFFSLVGCTSNIQYRTSFATTFPPTTNVTPDADPKAIIESSPDYKVGYVEFDDQGWFWDTHQRDYVEAMVRAEAGLAEHPADAIATTSPAKLSKGIILVTFVHGWKENAAYDGDGAASFRAILSKLSQFEKKQATLPGGHLPRKVVGVYAGWRGLSATWEPFKELSIFERKETAHKVGGYGAMTRLFTDLENIQKDSLDSLDPNAPRTELIIIGHSLGAGAVYSALSQIVTERFANTIGRGTDSNKQVRRLKPLGDQIILFNPAFEAARHFDLYQMDQAIQQFPPDQRPVLSIFTSNTDWATHYVFPISRWVGTLFDSIRPEADGINQRSANLDTVGWYQPFITHELHYSKSIAFSTTQPGYYNPVTKVQDPSAEESIRNIHKQQAKKPDDGQPYFFDHSILKPIHYRPGSPFVVVSVDKQIMDGHDDYANATTVNFIREYIEFCRVPTDRMK